MTAATPTARLAKALIGPAGEHYVLSQLLLRGYVAALAPPGTPDIDLLVTDSTGETFARVSVKACTRDKDWPMHERHERLVDERLFYALVDFEPQPTAVYFVPSAVVARVMATATALYLAKPGRHGQPRKPTDFRLLEQGYGEDMPDYRAGWLEPYRDRYDLLSTPARVGS